MTAGQSLTRRARDDVDCPDAVEFASDFVDDTLPALVRVVVGRHLADCEECRAYFEQMRFTVRVLRHLEPEPPPSDVVSRLTRAFRNRANGH